VSRELTRLTPAETSLFNTLRDNRLQANLRLEQERISFGWLQQALAATDEVRARTVNPVNTSDQFPTGLVPLE
jgi:hypothetical protein